MTSRATFIDLDGRVVRRYSNVEPPDQGPSLSPLAAVAAGIAAPPMLRTGLAVAPVAAVAAATALIPYIQTAIPEGDMYLIAPNDASTAIKDLAHEVVDGTDDHVQINNALLTYISIGLLPGTFDIGAPIEMQNGSVLSGFGWKTILKANGITTGTRAVITNDGATKARGCVVRDLQVHGNYNPGGPCHGIRFENDADLSGGPEPDTGPDACHKVINCLVSKCDGAGTTYGGISFYSPNSNNRAGEVQGCYARENGAYNTFYDGASDYIHIGNHYGGCNGDGVIAGGGNTQLFGSKQFFADGRGFVFDSARPVAGALIAQDNGTDGFDIVTADFHGGPLQADTNGRVAPGSGVRLASNRAMFIFHSLDRDTVTPRQDYGLELSGSPTGCVVFGTTYNNQIAAQLGSWGNFSAAIVGRDNAAPLLEGLASA